MRDVVVIGGGLSGLSACYELEKLRVPYTVIEVKRRFGGAIRSNAEAGFIMDACAFAFRRPAAGVLPTEFDLEAQIIPIGDDAFVFERGAESLVQAFARKLRGGRLMRMAVSSIGRLDKRFTICLENGLMLDAGALIVALPARYAARTLWNLAPSAAERLADFRYDSIRRVSLAYHKRDLPARIEGDRNETFPFIITTDQPGRVPDHRRLLIQVGLRASAEATADQSIRAVTEHFGWSVTPLVARVDHWLEADLLADYDGSHRASVCDIRDRLPAGLSLIGSDFCLEAPYSRGLARLDERILSGRAAARASVEFLKSGRNR